MEPKFEVESLSVLDSAICPSKSGPLETGLDAGCSLLLPSGENVSGSCPVHAGYSEYTKDTEAFWCFRPSMLLRIGI